jgi:hypothetical protein
MPMMSQFEPAGLSRVMRLSVLISERRYLYVSQAL